MARLARLRGLTAPDRITSIAVRPIPTARAPQRAGTSFGATFDILTLQRQFGARHVAEGGKTPRRPHVGRGGTVRRAITIAHSKAALAPHFDKFLWGNSRFVHFSVTFHADSVSKIMHNHGDAVARIAQSGGLAFETTPRIAVSERSRVMHAWLQYLLSRLAPEVNHHAADCRCWLCTEQPFRWKSRKRDRDQDTIRFSIDPDDASREQRSGSDRPAA
jgi:hypothetical protein